MQNWQDTLNLPEKPSSVEYAYILSGSNVPVSCSQETLVRTLSEKGGKVEYIATPNTKTFIIPGTTYETLQPLLALQKKAAYWELTKVLFLFAFVFLLDFLEVISIFDFIKAEPAVSLIVVLVGLFSLFNHGYTIISLNAINDSNYFEKSKRLLFNYWLDKEGTFLVWPLCAFLIFSFVVQLFFQFENQMFTEVSSGYLFGVLEFPRMLSNMLVNANIFLFLFSLSLIFNIGLFVEKIAGHWTFIGIFVFSNITQIILHSIISPEAELLGCLGGSLGLFGFAWVMSHKCKSDVPRYVRVEYLILAGFLLVLSMLFGELLDHASLLGGFFFGAISAFTVMKKNIPSIPFMPPQATQWLGKIALAVYLVAALLWLSQIFV